MTKTLTSLLLLLTITTASAVEIPVGYSKGIIASSSAYIVNGKGAVSAAVRLSPELLTPYVGNEIRGIAAGIVDSKYCDSIRVFVANELNGEWLATGLCSSKDTNTDKLPVNGWNHVVLENAVTIVEGQDLYIGYVFYQRYNLKVR